MNGMEITYGALIITAIVVMVVMVVTQIRMENEMIKEYEKEKKNRVWDWN